MSADTARLAGPSDADLIEGHRPIAPPTGTATWDGDPYDEAVLADPLDYYRDLRARGAFTYSSRYSILICGGYDVTREVFSDHSRFVSSRGVGLTDFSLATPWRAPSIILEVDPPDHTKARRAMTRALSPKAVNLLKDDFQRAADRLVDELLQRQDFDGVVDFAEAFPTEVFPQAVGLTSVDRRALIDYGAVVFNALGPDNALRRNALARVPDIVAWIGRNCERARLRPDGIGAAIYEAADAGELTETEAGMLVRSLLSAGVDTTVTGIGNALWCLATNPGEYARMLDDPDLIRPAFDEVLRYTSPVHSFCRTANQDTEVAGIAIPESAKILCVLGAANMDPQKWPEPERFDVARRPIGHLAFGAGIHGCVGQIIAKAEVEAVLTALAARVRRIELTGTPVWRPNNAIHALDSLPMRLIAK